MNGSESATRLQFEHGDSVVFGCNSDEDALQGHTFLACNNGTWSGALPKCIKLSANPERNTIFCRDPGVDPNGSRKPASAPNKQGFLPGSRLEFSCFQNYDLEGDWDLFCLMTGTWSADIPACVEKYASADYCLNPGGIENGRISYFPTINGRRVEDPEYSTGSQLQYSCNRGYTLVGDSSLVCLGTGEWSAYPPTCSIVTSNREPMYCETPDSILDGWFDIILPETFPGALHGTDPDLEYPEGTRLNYSCFDDYTLMGSSELICQSSGYWSSDPPICSAECGVSFRHTSRRVIHGTKSKAGEWPWVVAIAVQQNNFTQIICGGAVINSRTVVTAAHCLVAEPITLYFGKLHRSNSKDDADVMVRQSKRLILHPDYNSTTFDSDIALIKFEPSIRFTVRVQPICMPSPETTARNLMIGKQGYVTGWGLTEKYLAAEELLSAHLPVLSNSKCMEPFKGQDLGMPITQNMFCAGFEDARQATCTGDSGAPLVFYDRLTDRHTLEGLVSFGVQGQCGLPGRYTVFTKVFSFVPWILRKLRE